jgi:1,4-dihydroxy-2-naphthoate polyprenyltransferase
MSFFRRPGPMVLFAAPRPAFLSITAIAVLLGFAHAGRVGVPPSALLGILTLLGALVAPAAANVLNDVYDALSGSDDGIR